MTVQARMKCHIVRKNDYGANVYLRPVFSDDPNDPNYTYSQATPSGEITLAITNPNAVAFFEVDATYDVLFERYPAASADYVPPAPPAEPPPEAEADNVG